LAELCARAEHEGCLVLSGSASELERELPFWVFVDALDEYLRALEPSRLDALDEDGRAQLSHVFPCFSGHPTGSDAGSQDERFQTHRAVRRLLEALARPKPLVLGAHPVTRTGANEVVLTPGTDHRAAARSPRSRALRGA